MIAAFLTMSRRARSFRLSMRTWPATLSAANFPMRVESSRPAFLRISTCQLRLWSGMSNDRASSRRWIPGRSSTVRKTFRRRSFSRTEDPGARGATSGRTGSATARRNALPTLGFPTIHCRMKGARLKGLPDELSLTRTGSERGFRRDSVAGREVEDRPLHVREVRAFERLLVEGRQALVEGAEARFQHGPRPLLEPQPVHEDLARPRFGDSRDEVFHASLRRLREDRPDERPRVDPRFIQPAEGLEALRCWTPEGLDHTASALIEGRDRHPDVGAGEPAEQVEVAEDETGLRLDRHGPVVREEGLEAVPRHPVPALDRLVRVRHRADPHDAGGLAFQFPCEDEGHVPLHLDVPAPRSRVPEDGGRVAVAAADLAAPVRVQCVLQPREAARDERAQADDLVHLHGVRSSRPAAIARRAPSGTSYSCSSRTGTHRAFAASDPGIASPASYSHRISTIA